MTKTIVVLLLGGLWVFGTGDKALSELSFLSYVLYFIGWYYIWTKVCDFIFWNFDPQNCTDKKKFHTITFNLN